MFNLNIGVHAILDVEQNKENIFGFRKIGKL